jgi:hypothetical protein
MRRATWVAEFLGVLLVLGAAFSVLLGVALGRLTGLDAGVAPVLGLLLAGPIAWRVAGAPTPAGVRRRRRRGDDGAELAAGLIVLAAVAEHHDMVGGDGGFGGDGGAGL